MKSQQPQQLVDTKGLEKLQLSESSSGQSRSNTFVLNRSTSEARFMNVTQEIRNNSLQSEMSTQSDESSASSPQITTRLLFDPDRSNRETRKLARKIYTERKYHAVYDALGVNVGTGKDACDCLDEKCDGCHFPCLRCRSLKCGHECRQNRRWQYEPDFETERLPWTKVPLDRDDTTDTHEVLHQDQDFEEY